MEITFEQLVDECAGYLRNKNKHNKYSYFHGEFDGFIKGIQRCMGYAYANDVLTQAESRLREEERHYI